MRRCVLHIGWHKTGTTALQHFLHAQAELLAARGVYVPTFSANHSAFLPSAFLDDAPATYNEVFVLPLFGFEAIDKRHASRAITDDALGDERHGTHVFSAEDLCLLDRRSIERCHAELTAEFDEVEIVAYLRNHGNYAHSASQQLIRMGFSVDEVVTMATSGQAPISVLQPLPHYGPRLADWVDVFELEHMRLFSYDELRADGRSILTHFLDVVLGLRDPTLNAAAEAHPRVNTSFSAGAAYVLNRMNVATPLFVDGAPNPGFLFNRQRHLAAIAGPDAAAPADLRQPVLDARAADIEELADRIGPLVPDLPVPDTTPFEVASVPSFVGDPVMDQVADALDRAVAEAILGTARQKLFASMLRLRHPAARQSALRQIHLAKFLMADQSNLISSARWLLSIDEMELARAYLDKASRFADRPQAIADLVTLLDAASSTANGPPGAPTAPTSSGE